MYFQQIRNATIILHYAGKKLVFDPWLEDKQEPPALGPTVELPVPIEEITKNVDAFIVTHIHPDHFNEYGMPKDILMLVQNTEDQKKLMGMGFSSVKILQKNGYFFAGIQFYKTDGIHGTTDPEAMGKVCGVVLKSPKENTIYIAGDTIWCPDVDTAIRTHTPGIIVVNGCGASLKDNRLIMHQEDVCQVYKSAPKATIVVSHMEAVGHATVTRNDMKNYLSKKGIVDNVLIPDDGESYEF